MEQILKEVLEKNNLSGEVINEYASGQINHTYQIGEDYVVKVQKDLDVLLHQIPLLEHCLAVGAKVPKITDSGLVEGKEYIVMEKLTGRKLAEDWHTFSNEKQEGFIAQTTEQLKLLHSVPFEKYSPQRPLEFDSWKDALVHFTDFSVIEGKEFSEETKDNISILKNYFESNIQLLENAGSPVLVHNDLHFENILYEGGHITGILDFDFARQAPKEYELWHLVDFFHTPTYFVEEKLEEVWKTYTIGDELKLFRQYYPALFADDNLLTKVRMYVIEDILGHAVAGHTDRSNHQINAYFKTNWLEEKLGM